MGDNLTFEMRRLYRKAKSISSLSSQAQLNPEPVMDSGPNLTFGVDPYQDLVDDLELGVTPAWHKTFFRHLRLLLFVGASITAVTLWLIYYLKFDIIQALTTPLLRDTQWNATVTLRLLLWASIVLSSGILLSFLLSIVPVIALSVNRLVVPGKIETTKERIEAFEELRPTLLYSGCVVIAFTSLCVLFPTSITFDLDERGVLVSMFRVGACVLITSVLVMAEKMLMQLISVRFHRTAYKQRIQASRLATQILDKLNAAISKRGASYTKVVKFETNRGLRSRTLSDGESLSDTDNAEFSPPKTTGLGSLSNLLKLSSKVGYEPKVYKGWSSEALKKVGDDPTTHLAARKLAKKIFFALQKDQKHLYLEDFIPWFRDREEAEKAFNYFDRDQNGDISWEEMRDAIVRAYKERKDINKALRDTSQAVGKLHCFCLILACSISAALCGILFAKNARNVLISISTFFLGLTFIFGESAKQFFQSIIFLFFMHPYDVGDRVYIDTLQYIVKKVGLLGTEFRCTNGQITYIPHYILITKVIYNARRSERQVDVIEFQLSYDTPKEKLVELKESINHYLNEQESREFSGNPLLAIKAIEDCNQLKLFLSLEHKSNWQNNTQRLIRKTRFMLALRDLCVRLGLSYSLPVQRVIHLDAPVTYAS